MREIEFDMSIRTGKDSSILKRLQDIINGHLAPKQNR